MVVRVRLPGGARASITGARVRNLAALLGVTVMLTTVHHVASLQTLMCATGSSCLRVRICAGAHVGVCVCDDVCVWAGGGVLLVAPRAFAGLPFGSGGGGGGGGGLLLLAALLFLVHVCK